MPSIPLSPSRRLLILPAVALAGWLVVSPLAGAAHAEATVVPLGVVKQFSVLAGSTITNTGTTVVDRSIGLHPGSSITGTSTMVIGGTTHVGDALAQSAKADLTTAYDDAAGQSPRTEADGELAGETLTGGVYRRPAAMALTGLLTLDGQNDPDSVWVFQAGTTLTTGSGSSVVLINGASPCNVFWQVGSSATIGTGTSFVGNILADQSITMQTDARLRGRALARIGAVTLDTNVISSPFCASPDDDDDDDNGGRRWRWNDDDDHTGMAPYDEPGGGSGDGGDNGDEGDDGGSGQDDVGDGGGGGQIDVPPTGGVPTGTSAGEASGGDAPASTLLLPALALAALGLVGAVAVRRPVTVRGRHLR